MTQTDPDFGLMTFEDDCWTLSERQATLGNRRVPIIIQPENIETREISPLQREAVQQALSLSPDVLRLSAPAVLQNYEVYREAIGDEEMPSLDDDPLQVWEEVTMTEIVIPPHPAEGKKIPGFLLNAECTWDPEHGLTVRFRNGIADAADQQGELGLTD